MIILFILWFLLLLIGQIIYLVKSVKTKNNKNWIILFTLILSSFLSDGISIYYSFKASNYLGWSIIVNIVVCAGALISQVIMLVISFIFKLVEIKKLKKININKEKLLKSTKTKAILFPLFIVILISILIGGFSNMFLKIEKEKTDKIELQKYNEIKEEEIDKMSMFINQKYNYNFSAKDCIYYREEDYTKHTDIFGNGKTYNIPYIAVFEKDGKRITVADRKGFLSDDGQIEEINYYIGDYFTNISGIDIEYVQIRETGNGNIDDDTIKYLLQYKFNEKITENNINSFMDEVFKMENLELIFYVKDVDNRKDMINTLTLKLSYLKDYINIERVMIYFYGKTENLIVTTFEKELDDEYKQYNTSDDYYDDYKFSYSYVPNDYEYYYPDSDTSNFKNEKFNTFVAAAYYNLDRGYSAGQGNKNYEIINNWYIYNY